MSEKVPGFSSVYPTTEKATIPEFHKAETIAGLMPGFVTVQGKYNFNFDVPTGQLFVKTNSELETDEDPRLEGAVGLMRIVDDANGYDGFIADFRYVRPGSLLGDHITAPAIGDREPSDEYYKSRQAHGGYQPLLAAVFADPDGKPHFVGDPAMIDHAQSLMAQINAMDKDYQPEYADTVIPENYLG